MQRNSLATVLDYFQRTIGFDGPGAGTDSELLSRFVSKRDETAFTVLVRRHGPMILGVCRRLMRHAQDSEDVFQATFLTLVRKAGSIGKREALASWLHKVAFRIAGHARCRPPTRSLENDIAEERPCTDSELMSSELRAGLDEEIARLPEKYRRPILLCYFEGKTHEEAGHVLGWPTGTVAGRLSRAKDILRRRLTNRGCTLSSSALAAIVAEKALAAPVSAELVRATVRSALAYASGKTAVTLSGAAVALTEGVLRMMWLTKIKMAAAGILALVVAATGVGLAVRNVWAMEGPEAPLAAPNNRPKPNQQQEAPAAAQGDAAAEIVKLRTEIAKLRAELDSAIKEIKSLKDFLRQGVGEAEPAPLYKGKTAKFWLEQYQDADPEFRVEAVKALGSLARKNKDLVPTLVAGLSDTYRDVRHWASQALGQLGPEVLPPILELLKSEKSPTTLEYAVYAIIPMGSKAKEAVPILTDLLSLQSHDLRRVTVRALGSVGSEAKPAIPAMVAILKPYIMELEPKASTAKKPTKPQEGQPGKLARQTLDLYSLPGVIFYAIAVIDPAAQESLPKEFANLAKAHPDARVYYPDYATLQEAHTALKKRYLKDK